MFFFKNSIIYLIPTPLLEERGFEDSDNLNRLYYSYKWLPIVVGE